MKDLKKLVLDKIEELGDAKATEYFGKTRQTIHAWKTGGGQVPLAAVQQVLNDTPQETEEPDPATAPETPQPAPTTPNKGWMDSVEARLGKLEDFARSLTDPDLKAQPSSLVRPSPVVPTQPQPPPADVDVPAEQPQEAVVDDFSPKFGDINKPRPVVRK